MSVKRRLRTLFCCAVLELGALTGVPMRPEEIRDLLQTLNKPKIAQTNPQRTADGDTPAAGESSRSTTVDQDGVNETPAL